MTEEHSQPTIAVGANGGMKVQNEQLTIGVDGSVKGELERKIETAIQRLQSFEPPDGYYVAFSGGKDSQCVYHLCKLGG